MGRALGVYDDRMRDDLRWIKDIRNAFAHTRFKIDFQTPEVQAAVEQLNFGGSVTLAEVTVPTGGSTPIPVEGNPVILTARQRFTGCASTLASLLRFDQGTSPRRLLGTPLYPYRVQQT